MLFRILMLALWAFTAGASDEMVAVPKGSLLPVAAPREVVRPTTATTSVLFSDDFESGQGAWTITDGVWEIGVPSVGPSGAYSGTQCAGTVLNGDYPNNSNTRLVSPAVSLPQQTGGGGSIRLSFRHWYEIESCCDRGTVEVSTDGGASWTPMGNGYAGTTQATWHSGTVLLDQFAGTTAHIAFRFTSDGSVRYSGWFVDDVMIEYEEPEPLNVEITSISPSLFPLVFVSARVDTFDRPASEVPSSSFQAFEDGVLQTDAFEVTPPDTGAGMRVVDIVFCMDNSGSMSDEIAAVAANVTDFVNDLAASGADFALGLIRFGSGGNGGWPILEDNGQLTSDIGYFINDLWARNQASGSFEPGWDALHMAATQITYRPGATRVVILITDETPSDNGNIGIFSNDQALSALLDNSITSFSLVELSDSHAYEDYGTIAEDTGGLYFDILTPMDEILDAIFGIVGNTYIVRYRTSNTALTGLREVILRVDYQGVSAQDTAYYQPMSAPVITLTPQSQAIIDAGHVVAGYPVDLGVYIIDLAEPFVQSATLFYRHTGATAFGSVTMVHMSDSLYQGTIPASAVNAPGIDLYVSATDGVSTTSLPATDPLRNPLQIGVWPNEKPLITHTIPSWARIGANLTITASIVDQTNHVQIAEVRYRAGGAISYQSATMTATGGASYLGTIPGAYVTPEGVQYYLYAEDDFGVGSYHGSPESPHHIPALDRLFEVDFDGYSFINSRANMWPQECWASPQDSRFPTWEIFREAFSAPQVELGGQPTQWANTYWQRIAAPYGGSCFGFATSALLFYEGHLSLDSLSWTDADSVYGICQGVAPIGNAGVEGDSVRFLVNTYQLYQYGDQFNDYMATVDGIAPPATVDTIMVGMGRRALLLRSLVQRYVPGDGMTQPQWLGGGHAVVPYRVESDNGRALIYVYDSNAPGDTTRFVELDQTTNQWQYRWLQYVWRDRNGVVHSYGDWTDTQGLSPSPDISVFHETPRLPWWGSTGGPSRPTYPSSGTASHVEVLVDRCVEALIEDASQRRIGVADTTFVDEVPGGFPLIAFGIDSSCALPYGYHLPLTSVYRMVTSSRRDTLYDAAIFGTDAMFAIDGTRLGAGERDMVTFEPSGARVGLHTTASSKSYSVRMMRPFPDHERIFSFEERGLSARDSVVYDFSNPERLSVMSKGAARTYDLRILRAGAAPDSFAASGITIAPNTTHTVVVQDWAQPRQRILIEIDVGSDGTPDDTLHLSQTPATSGSLTGDNIYAYPNPFNPDKEQAMIRFSVEQTGNVTITITDATGTKVVDLLKDHPVAANAEQSIAWNGRDKSGKVVANGVYFYIIETDGGKRAIGKLAVLR